MASLLFAMAILALLIWIPLMMVSLVVQMVKGLIVMCIEFISLGPLLIMWSIFLQFWTVIVYWSMMWQIHWLMLSEPIRVFIVLGGLTLFWGYIVYRCTFWVSRR